MRKVKIVNKSKHPLPKYETKQSVGMDLSANINVPYLLGAWKRTIIPTGIHISLPKPKKNIFTGVTTAYELQIRPRSGKANKNGITVLNTPGTIDPDYRGEIGVILINLSDDPYVINDGDKIAQGVVNKVELIEWEVVETLDETERGSGGFGHTG